MEMSFDYLLCAFWLIALMIFITPMAIMERRQNESTLR